MADNYLEKKFEELREKRPVIKRNHLSLDTLLRRNRSYRGYDPARVVTREELKKLVEVTTLVPSGKNLQALRYRLVTAEESDKVLPLIRMGAALPELHLPFPGTEPRAFLVICSTIPENPVLDIDLGIAAQSLLLKAVEMGLNGLIIRAFDPGKMQEALGLELVPLLVIAIGKGAENIFLKPVDAGESLAYYRKDGVHFVRGLVHPRTSIGGGARRIQVICAANDAGDVGRGRSEAESPGPLMYRTTYKKRRHPGRDAVFRWVMRRLVGHDRIEGLGELDELRDFLLDRGAAAEVLLFVHLGELGGEIRSIAVAELFHGVHTGGLEQFGELRADTLDAEQVRMVHPRENAAVIDTGGILDGLTALGVGALLEELVYGFNADANELLGVHRADTLNVDNLVSHIKICV